MNLLLQMNGEPININDDLHNTTLMALGICNPL